MEKEKKSLRLILENFKTTSIVKIEDAWIKGMQLSKSLRIDKSGTKALLVKEIFSLVNYIDANKTLNQEDILEAVEFILEDYWHYTIEEIICLIRQMKKETGYFERLKYPEIKKKLDEHFASEKRAKMIEDHNLRFKKKELDKDQSHNWAKREDYIESINQGKESRDQILEKKDDKEKNEKEYNNFKADYLSKKSIN